MATLDIEEITEIQKHLLLCKSLSFRRKLALDLGLYKVVVAGTSNSGKSTLVNALSGRELLPESHVYEHENHDLYRAFVSRG